LSGIDQRRDSEFVEFGRNFGKIFLEEIYQTSNHVLVKVGLQVRRMIPHEVDQQHLRQKQTEIRITDLDKNTVKGVQTVNIE
jgi:hypothetical protein